MDPSSQAAAGIALDPISTAIIAKLAADMIEGVAKAGASAIAGRYCALKAMIEKKRGKDSSVAKAVAALEDAPDSPSRQRALAKEVAAAILDQDSDLRQAADDLRAAIEAQPGGKQVVQTAIGSYIAQATDHSTASVNVNQPTAPDPSRPFRRRRGLHGR